MSANVYECMLLLDSGKYNSDAAGVVGNVHGILEKHQAEILVSRPWDERRLAYPVSGHKKGMYYLMYWRCAGKQLRPIEQDFHLNESILRTLTLKVDPKMVDTMLAVARDEHAGVAVQAPGLRDDVVDMGGGRDLGRG